ARRRAASHRPRGDRLRRVSADRGRRPRQCRAGRAVRIVVRIGARTCTRARSARRRGPALTRLLQLRHVRQLRTARPRVQATRRGARRRALVSTAATPTRERALSAAQVRDRWRMGTEARGLILVMALLLTFGLAV